MHATSTADFTISPISRVPWECVAAIVCGWTPRWRPASGREHVAKDQSGSGPRRDLSLCITPPLLCIQGHSLCVVWANLLVCGSRPMAVRRVLFKYYTRQKTKVPVARRCTGTLVFICQYTNGPLVFLVSVLHRTPLVPCCHLAIVLTLALCPRMPSFNSIC